MLPRWVRQADKTAADQAARDARAMVVIHGIFDKLDVKDVMSVDGFKDFMDNLRGALRSLTKGFGDYFIKCVTELHLMSFYY